jgi:hypothetical protein
MGLRTRERNLATSSRICFGPNHAVGSEPRKGRCAGRPDNPFGEGAICLPSRAQRPTGGGRGGCTAASRPRDAAVAGLAPPGRPKLLSGSCSRPPRASPRGKWLTAGLRRDPIGHLSAGVLLPRSHHYFQPFRSHVIRDKCAVSAALTPRILGTTKRSSLCGCRWL